MTVVATIILASPLTKDPSDGLSPAGFHFSVHEADAIAGKRLASAPISLLKAFEVELLILLNKGIYDIDLPSLPQLGKYQAVNFHAGGIVAQKRGDGFASGRQLVDDRDIEVAVDGHSERPGDGGGGHYKDVGPSRSSSTWRLAGRRQTCAAHRLRPNQAYENAPCLQSRHVCPPLYLSPRLKTLMNPSSF